MRTHLCRRVSLCVDSGKGTPLHGGQACEMIP